MSQESAETEQGGSGLQERGSMGKRQEKPLGTRSSGETAGRTELDTGFLSYRFRCVFVLLFTFIILTLLTLKVAYAFYLCLSSHFLQRVKANLWTSLENL